MYANDSYGEPATSIRCAVEDSENLAASIWAPLKEADGFENVHYTPCVIIYPTLRTHVIASETRLMRTDSYAPRNYNNNMT